ncbi:hypothetical protein ABPG77_006680 [Micractinium sp. CCAP 211/92]
MAAVLSFRSSRLATLGRQATGAPPALWRPRQRQGRPSVAGGAGAAAAAGRRPLRVCAVAQPLGPAVTPHEVDALHAEVQLSVQERLRGYYQLLRGWNALPSMALVLLGAWTGAGKTLLALKFFTVWFMGLASGAVAMASCAINDYFDWKIDAMNDSTKPIPSGRIAPDRALLAACLLYIGLLALACLVPNTGVRLIVAVSSAATVLYTPFFKKQTLVKNCVVATTIAAAPLAGALAAGAAGPGLHAVLAPSAFLWLGIMHREIMMDIQDRRGDGAAGVQTLPVVLGPRGALAFCLALLAACSALAVSAALQGSGLAWAWAGRPALEAPLRCAALGCVAWVLSCNVASTLGVLRSRFGREEVTRAINVAMSSVSVGTVLLALLV